MEKAQKLTPQVAKTAVLKWEGMAEKRMRRTIWWVGGLVVGDWACLVSRLGQGRLGRERGEDGGEEAASLPRNCRHALGGRGRRS